jgi:hypothetical protein
VLVLLLAVARHVSMVCDTEALLGGAPITDSFFLAPALYCFDTHNAGEWAVLPCFSNLE